MYKLLLLNFPSCSIDVNSEHSKFPATDGATKIAEEEIARNQSTGT